MVIYCPYTDKEIESSSTNNEHIFPLSLGGSNSFTLPVNRNFNSKAGSDIDGDIANDLLTLFRRRHFDARGHSKKKPKVHSKKSTIGSENRPVQIELKGVEGVQVYDPREKRYLADKETVGENLSLQFPFSQHGRLRFAAKVALAGGYFVFGDWFRNNVVHQEVRALMNFNSVQKKEDFSGFKLKAYDEFSLPEKKDIGQYELDNFVCKTIGGSCVYFIPGSENIGVVIGVLGQHVATLNIAANTDKFPFSDQNDLGHAVVIESGQMQRMSYRELIKSASFHLPKNI